MSNLGKYKKKVKEIEKLRDAMMALSDEALKNKTEEFRQRHKNGATLDVLLPEAFAVVREATRRVLHTEHYPVQLIGGMALHEGCIAELKTGEGKTQTCLLPAYLNALDGKGVHVVTVNDYLANRDAIEMGKVHNFLGLSVGCVLANMSDSDRRVAYNKDITYVTNSEAGFDYLRDNMVSSLDQKVQRELHYAIIDEADSILIDEARTPLIIAGKGPKPSDLYNLCDEVAKKLTKGVKKDTNVWEEIDESGDFVIAEKEKIVTLTDRGIKKVEKAFGLQNYSDVENIEIQHGMIMALRANNIMHKNKDYVVRDGKIEIVDEFTGRILDGRRFTDGLHQAIEAKEGVEIQPENITKATITYQHFFNKYSKKAGMTGTAATEKTEFKEIFHMDVVEVPTNRPVIRLDEEDRVYRTKNEKYHEVMEEIVAAHDIGQPILVGTTNVETSELLSRMLKNRNIKHQVLNAKHHAREAEIVSHAGEFGAVTIATNMAGRGTDIKLEDKSKEAGGLLVIGTERHEARRIDNQLRGRSGRQGDPGRSVFFLSLEDDLMTRYGSKNVLEAFKKIKIPQNTLLQSKGLSKAIQKAQIRIEGQHYNIRKQLLDFDTVNEEQRNLIYAERDRILAQDDLTDTYKRMAIQIGQYLYDKYSANANAFVEWSERLFRTTPSQEDIVSEENMRKFLNQCIEDGFEEMMNRFPNKGIFLTFAASVFLKTMDEKWIRHIDMLTRLRENITLQAYGQKDPRIEYRTQAYQMFDNLLLMIKASIISILYSAQVSKKPVPTDHLAPDNYMQHAGA